MRDSMALYLPLNTYGNVRSFTNAAFTQRVTIVEENGAQHQLEGSGEYATYMPSGSFSIQVSNSGAGANLMIGPVWAGLQRFSTFQRPDDRS